MALYYPPKAKKSWTKRVTYVDSEAMSSFREAVKGPVIYESSSHIGNISVANSDDTPKSKAKTSSTAIKEDVQLAKIFHKRS